MPEEMVKVVMGMFFLIVFFNPNYDTTNLGCTKMFEVKVRLHHGSIFSPLFLIVIEELMNERL